MNLSKELLIIIPTYNEEGNIVSLLEKINQFCAGVNLLFVDDNSSDKTIEKIKKYQKKLPIEILHRKGKLGLGSAYIEGMKLGLKKQYNYFLQMDADLSHNPQYIPAMLEKIKNF